MKYRFGLNGTDVLENVAYVYNLNFLYLIWISI